jgi:hypothetical protein
MAAFCLPPAPVGLLLGFAALPFVNFALQLALPVFVLFQTQLPLEFRDSRGDEFGAAGLLGLFSSHSYSAPSIFVPDIVQDLPIGSVVEAGDSESLVSKSLVPESVESLFSKVSAVNSGSATPSPFFASFRCARFSAFICLFSCRFISFCRF